jgi:hypothetical protein
MRVGHRWLPLLEKYQELYHLELAKIHQWLTPVRAKRRRNAMDQLTCMVQFHIIGKVKQIQFIQVITFTCN